LGQLWERLVSPFWDHHAIHHDRDEWLVFLDDILESLRTTRTIEQPMANATASPFFATLPRLSHESWQRLNLGLSALESCLMAAPSSGRVDTNKDYLERLVGALRVLGRVLTGEQMLQTVLDPRSWRLETPFDTWAREFLYRAHPELTVEQMVEWMQRQNGEQKQPGGDPVFFHHMGDKVLDVCAALREATYPARPRVKGSQESGREPGDTIPSIPDPIRMSIAEAAKFVGVSDRTIREWRSNGKLLVIEDEKGHLVFSKSTLEMLRDSR
jgi:hypothetical protein